MCLNQWSLIPVGPRGATGIMNTYNTNCSPPPNMKIDACDTEKSGTLDCSEKTIAISGDGGWTQTTKQKEDKTMKTFLCNTWKKRNEGLNVGGVSYYEYQWCLVSKVMHGQSSND